MSFNSKYTGAQVEAWLDNIKNYSANDILEKLKTVDGSDSGLDADKLDGNEETSFYRHRGYIEDGVQAIDLPYNGTYMVSNVDISNTDYPMNNANILNFPSFTGKVQLAVDFNGNTKIRQKWWNNSPTNWKEVVFTDSAIIKSSSNINGDNTYYQNMSSSNKYLLVAECSTRSTSTYQQFQSILSVMNRNGAGTLSIYVSSLDSYNKNVFKIIKSGYCEGLNVYGTKTDNGTNCIFRVYVETGNYNTISFVGICNQGFTLPNTLESSTPTNVADISYGTASKLETTTATTGEYIYAQDSSGNSVKINKSDLVSIIHDLLPESSLSNTGLINSFQKISMNAGKILSVYSSNVYHSLGYIVLGLANGVRAMYLVNPAEYNNDNGQIPKVCKLGASWANPVEFYYKKEGTNNKIVFKTHTNGSCVIIALGSTGITLNASYISDVSGYTSITVESMV